MKTEKKEQQKPRKRTGKEYVKLLSEAKTPKEFWAVMHELRAAGLEVYFGKDRTHVAFGIHLSVDNDPRPSRTYDLTDRDDSVLPEDVAFAAWGYYLNEQGETMYGAECLPLRKLSEFASVKKWTPPENDGILIYALSYSTTGQEFRRFLSEVRKKNLVFHTKPGNARVAEIVLRDRSGKQLATDEDDGCFPKTPVVSYKLESGRTSACGLVLCILYKELALRNADGTPLKKDTAKLWIIAECSDEEDDVFLMKKKCTTAEMRRFLASLVRDCRNMDPGRFLEGETKAEDIHPASDGSMYACAVFDNSRETFTAMPLSSIMDV